MRVTKQQAALNRQRILDSAIRLFAERGVDGVGVAEIMAGAGFTHGGFYNHFTSKDDLVLQACSTSFARTVSSLRQEVPMLNGEGTLGACLSAAMLTESAKADDVASVYADGIREFVGLLTDQFGERDRAVDALARYVGARILARAVEAADRDLAEEFATVLHPSRSQGLERLQASS